MEAETTKHPRISLSTLKKIIQVQNEENERATPKRNIILGLPTDEEMKPNTIHGLPTDEEINPYAISGLPTEYKEKPNSIKCEPVQQQQEEEAPVWARALVAEVAKLKQ